MPSSNPRYYKPKARNNIRKQLRLEQRPCALCGLPIDYTLKTPHPMSFEVDEIVPVSLGGDPCDINNCQPAHRICNQRKGNKIAKIDEMSENDEKKAPMQGMV